MKRGQSLSREARSGDLRWNFGAGVIDAAGWGAGMSLVSATTILPLFVSRLTDSPVAVGMIQAVMLFGWLLPGILVSGWVERLPRVKTSVMWIAALERLALFVLAPLCLFFGAGNPAALLAAFFLVWLIMNAAMGANLPGYYKLIAKTIPAEYRGRLYGIGGAISGFVGVGGAALVGWFLQRWEFPGGFAACFLAASIVQTVTFVPIAFMREPEQSREATLPDVRPLQRLALIREDSRLRWLCVAVALFSFNQMGAAFHTLFAIDRLDATEADVARFTAAVTGARAVAFLLVGWLGDRFGNRAAMQVATTFGVAAAALAWHAPGVTWMYAVFMLNEVAVQGWGVCSVNYVLELCPTERSGTYTAVFGVFTGPLRVGLPLVGGALAAMVGFQTLFAAGVVGGLVTLVVLATRVPEPRRTGLTPGIPNPEGART
jgi:MFS family permease